VELALDGFEQASAKSTSTDNGIEGNDLARRPIDVIGHQPDQLVLVINEGETLDIRGPVDRTEADDEAVPMVLPHLLDFILGCRPQTHIVLSKWCHLNLLRT
jgi:hypothetical protein